MISIYCIAGNYGEVFNLANWQFYEKLPNLKSATVSLYVTKSDFLFTTICVMILHSYSTTVMLQYSLVLVHHIGTGKLWRIKSFGGINGNSL